SLSHARTLCSSLHDALPISRNRPFGDAESPPESRFSEPAESAFGGLERRAKRPIYSITCGPRLCARRNASFVAQIAGFSASPHRSEEHTSELQSPYELACRL